MTKPLSVSEAASAYGTDEYQHLHALAVDEAQRQQAGWQALEALLRDVHQRPSDATSEQIEAEIGTARAEAKKARHE